MLFFNQLMFKFLFNSLELNGATVTSTINFIFNNCLNALSDAWPQRDPSLYRCQRDSDRRTRGLQGFNKEQ